MKKRIKKGSMTIEAALLMPLLLLVVMITLYLFFYVHNKVWLTAAAYEAALDGSLETARPEGKSRDKALKKGKELGNSGFYESKKNSSSIVGRINAWLCSTQWLRKTKCECYGSDHR